MNKREPSIDILRFIGLSLLILAHVDSPFIIHQIRMFDVPMMVFISGLSYGGKDIDDIGKFYLNRIKRLLIPVWTFIPIYLAPLAILQATGVLRAGLTWSGFFGSFVFYGEAMGYIWIYKVFLIVMLFAPLLIRINNRTKSNSLYFLYVLSIIALQQLLCVWCKSDPSIPFKGLMETYGLYILGYLPLFMLGLRVRSSEIKIERLFLFLVGAVTVFSAVFYYYSEGLPYQLTTFKYPPQAYYIIYGCFMSILLWYYKAPITKVLDNKFVLYVGQNSDWIYLWHAFFVFYVTYVVKQWYFQYFIIYALAIVFCVIQKKIVSRTNSCFIRKYY